ncbi:MAG TPA: cob(I)yrinic acid a,c-diamide adenosyltransferase [bacterium]|nr:cob(I)yrinic acid a,c-diamide adenosyltransferase [bacterium]
MKIYTRTGDEGDTGLFGGGRVPKDDTRVEAYGELDEANAAMGVARATGLDTDLDDILAAAQHALFDLGAELATPPDANRSAQAKVPHVSVASVTKLEEEIDRLTAELPPQTHFILPGGSESAAALHEARTVLRRAERRVVTLHHRAPLRAEILQYVNRLSDLLFVMARAANHRKGVPEVIWKS